MNKLLLAILLFCHFNLCGQYDFSFERPIQINNDAPGEWSIYSNSGQLCRFSSKANDGNNCLCIERKDSISKNKLHFFAQMIINNHLQEIKNELLFKIDLKGEFYENDTIKVDIRSFQNDFTLVMESTHYLLPNKIDEWLEYEIKQKVSSQNVMHIFFEFTYHGYSDKVEMDNLRFLIDGKPFKNRETEIDSEMIDLITKHCYPIENFDIETANISHFFDDKTIVGLGENSHGCHEIQVLRRSIVNSLLSTKKFKNIIIEDNYFRTHFLNQALHSRDTSSLGPAIVNLQYWINKHLEMYKLLRDISTNENLKDVNIFGCDFFLNKSFIKFMVDGNTKSKPQIDAFKSYFDAMDFYAIFNSNNTEKDWYQEKEMFCSLYPNESLTKFQNEMCYKTFDFTLRKFTKNSSKLRDKGLFELTSEIIDQKGKSIILAHNGHIGNFTDVMGSYLKEKYHKKYITIGFLFYEGSYLAKNSGDLEEFQFRANDETYESLFNKIPYDVFFIDLKELVKNKAILTKLSPRGFYGIGATSHFSTKSFDVTSLEQKFDYIIFIKNISPLKF